MSSQASAGAVDKSALLPQRLGRVASFSWGIANNSQVKSLLQCQEIVYRPRRADGIDAVVGWGNKNNTIAAVEFAHRHHLPYLRLEDGFLRSVGLGVEGDAALSLVVDDLGIFYDARRPSRLEEIIEKDARLEDEELLLRAQKCISEITRAGLSKYNNSTFSLPKLSEGKKRVLVIDQTAGDLSIVCGLGRPQSFRNMLRAAIEENTEAEIYLKIHPDVLSGKKHSDLWEEAQEIQRKGISRSGEKGGTEAVSNLHIISEASNPIRLLEKMDRVYCVTSQMGFEALLIGKEVSCFGAPFYAGWGLTDDRISVPRRGLSRTVEQIFAAAYILYTRYLNPDTGASGSIEEVIEHLALQRRQFDRSQGKIFCFGFRMWKHGYVRSYLRCPGNEIHFPRSCIEAEKMGFDLRSKIVVWGMRGEDEAEKLARRHGVDIWRMEDGFLRSVGLGSDMVAPASLVVDRMGIYFDPQEPSELEWILQNHDFSDAELQSAESFLEKLLDSGLSKYNVGDHQKSLSFSTDKKLILVPGQVEDDASIKRACPEVCTNLGLLKATREAHPEAFVVYKPHPDVLSGNRIGAIVAEEALKFCDRIEEEASLAQCLAVADEVSVMSSLVGFEALLRGRKVHCHGMPFYAGWGLTQDHLSIERRTRKLSLLQLVAGSYLLYPRYLNRETQKFTSAEQVLSELQAARASGVPPLKIGWGRRQLRKLRHIAKEMRRA